MELFFNILLFAGPLILGTYLSTIKKVTARTRKIVWSICIVISLVSVLIFIYKQADRSREEAKNKYYETKLDKVDLILRGHPADYVNGLGDNPFTKHHLLEGQKLVKESLYAGAIKEFKKCLSHPRATVSNKLAAHILIGNCYYDISRLKEAEDHYKEAFNLSFKVGDKSEKLQGKSAALGNIGLIYSDLGKPE